jgi:ribonuclease HI
MKQGSIFDDQMSQSQKPHVLWTVFIDGASRNNPGRSGVGIVIYKNDVKVASVGYYLGIKTNNQAEYGALLFGIYLLKKSYYSSGDYLQITSDSLLLVQQMKGVYKIRNSELQKMNACARHLLAGIPTSFIHVLREENKEADAMANWGVDAQKVLPHDFITMLATHDIAW